MFSKENPKRKRVVCESNKPNKLASILKRQGKEDIKKKNKKKKKTLKIKKENVITDQV